MLPIDPSRSGRLRQLRPAGSTTFFTAKNEASAGRLRLFSENISMQIRDLPNEVVVVSVVSPIKDFTVFLVYQGGLKGSGTLVKCGDRFGVLTAYHVIHRGRRLDFSSGSTESLGFCVDAYPTALYMPLNRLNLIDVGVPVTRREWRSGP